MSFGSVLKTILAFNDIKMYNLANALGYDKSYISKWVSGAKLPPSKDLDRLTDSIARFVAAESDEGRRRMTARHFGFARKDGSAPDSAAFTAKLAELLREEYWRGRYAAEEIKAIVPQAPQMPSSRRRSPAVECILATQPVTKSGEFQSVTDDLAALDPDNSRLKMTVLIDPERFDRHVDLYWRHICRLLSIGGNADVDLVEIGRSSGTLPERLLIARDRFVEQSVQLPFSSRTVAVKTDVPSVVELYWDDARKFIRQQQVMLESSNQNNNLYYYKYSSTTRKRYLLSSMFPMYMTESLFDELEDGSRFDLKVLSDKNPILNYGDMSVSFFMNDTSAYCSDIRKKKDGVRYFVSADSRRNLGILLDHIHGLSGEYLMTGKTVIDYIFDGMKNM